MIIIIVEEIIPLVVLYAPFILPSTCILPTQKDRIDTKKREKQRVLVASYPDVFTKLAKDQPAEVSVESFLSEVTLKPLSGYVIFVLFLFVSFSFGVQDPRTFDLRSSRPSIKCTQASPRNDWRRRFSPFA